MAGRHSRLKDPEFAKAVAELYISGKSRREMAEVLNCAHETIHVWVKDPRVQAHATRLTIERINRITRRIDGEMEARLAHVGNWKTEELLKVRKEYLERSWKGAGGSESMSTTGVTEEIAEAMDSNPELAEALRALVGDPSGDDSEA